MAGPEPRSDFAGDTASRAAMLLLQIAAAQAQIGPFARRALETPQSAARLYEIAASRVALPDSPERRGSRRP